MGPGYGSPTRARTSCSLNSGSVARTVRTDRGGPHASETSCSEAAGPPAAAAWSAIVELAVAMALVSGAVATVATPAGAAPRWPVAPSPSPPGPPNGELAAVSCASATDCFAVGGGIANTVIEHWDGTTWTVVPSPAPSGAPLITFGGVSCPSATSCFAVGDIASESSTTFTDETLIEHWDGTKWSIVASPDPRGTTDASLLGVSCSSATSCFAVGDYITSPVRFTSTTLVERWDGTKWSIVASPVPTGATDASLLGVSCSSPTSCFAVGDFASRATGGPLLERWDGSTWSVVAGAAESGAFERAPEHRVVHAAGRRAGSGFGTSPGLDAVWCTSATSCFAVGTGSTGTLIEGWNGSSWSDVAGPTPHGASGAELFGVSCSGPTDCTAVGDSFTDSATSADVSEQTTLAEHWDGTSWAIVAGPSGAILSQLNGVSCPAPASCAAVGDSTLAERWDGASWSVAPLTTQTSESQLTQVSCTSATRCFAVGSAESDTGISSLVERWDGARWSIVPSPNPPGALVAELAGVACTSATSCFAVGISGDLVHGLSTLVERWNGTSWSIVPSPNPNPRGPNFVQLNGVACANRNSCNAVGYTFATAGPRPVAEHWNGKTWALVAVPIPATKGTNIVELNGVTCPSPTDCTAAGFVSTDTETTFTTQPLLEHWNGTSWSVVPTVPPGTTDAAQLLAVSCASATDCAAVGLDIHLGASPFEKALTEHWDGKTWNVVPSATVRGSAVTTLSGVTCRSPVSCYAVGAYVAASRQRTLVEHWDGAKWSAASSASPSGADGGVGLTGVSCPTPTNCTAVGSYGAHDGRFTLALQGG